MSFVDRRLRIVARGAIAIAALIAATAQAVPFGNGGIAIPPIYIPGGDAYPAAVVVQADGKLIVVGTAEGPVPQTMFAARFTASGALDPTYGIGGRAFAALPDDSSLLGSSAAVLDANGNVVIAGTVATGSGGTAATSMAVARLTPAGIPDPTFGVNGFRLIEFTGYNQGSSARSIGLDSLGRIVVAGEASDSALGRSGYAIARLTPSGSLDTGFNGTGQRVVSLSDHTFGVGSMAIDAANKIVVVGVADSSVVRLTASGQLDTSFNGTGIVSPVPGGTSLRVDSSGRVLVGGMTNTFGTITYHVTRLTNAGAPDASFGSGGSTQFGVAPQFVNTSSPLLALDYLGRIILSFGADDDVQKVHVLTVARFLETGAFDTGFNGSGLETSPLASTPRAIATDANNKLIFAGGQAASVNGPANIALTRMTSSGAMDPTFNGTGTVVQNCGLLQVSATSMIRQSDGKLVVAGSVGPSFIPPSDFLVARLTSSGALDPSFNGIGYRVINVSADGLDAANAIALDGSGNIVLAGQDGTANFAVARVTPNGAMDTTFNATGKKVIGGPATGNGGAKSVAIDASGNILLAGQAPAASGQGFQVVRLTPTGALDPTFAAGGIGIFPLGAYDQNQSTRIAIDSAGRIVVGGWVAPHINFCSSFGAIRLTGAGTLDTTFAGTGVKTAPITTDCVVEVNGLAIDSADRIVLAGSSQGVANVPPAVIRLTSSGVVDPAFNAAGINAGLRVRAAAMDGAGAIFLGGARAQDVVFFYDMGLLKLAADGTIDQTFNAGQVMSIAPTPSLLSSSATAIVLEAPDGIYLAGNTGRSIAVVKLFQSAPTAVEIASINGGKTVIANKPFDVLVQSRDDLGNPQRVSAATTIALTLKAGTGVLSGGLSCTIPAGGTTCSLLGVTYSKVDSNIVLTASAVAGDPLDPSDSAPFVVEIAQSTTEVTSDVNPSLLGQTVTFTATVTAPKPLGQVAFLIDSTTISGCTSVPLAGSGTSRTAKCSTSSLRLGWNNIQASYSGDANTQASAGWMTQNVDPASINVALAANGGVASASSSYSGFYPASAVNNGDRAGRNNGFSGVWKDATVQSFPDWVQIDFSGAKTIDHVIVYSVQDNDSNPVEPTDTMTFTQRGITAFEVQSWNGAAWVSLGTVSGNNLVKRSVAFPATTTSRIRVLINAVSNGRYSLVAEIEAWTTGGAPPPPPPPTPTTTTLSSSLNPSKVGDPVTFTASVSGSAPTGSVNFTDGASSISGCAAVALSGGSAQCPTSALAQGTHAIVAKYSGDPSNTVSQSAPLSQVVNSNGGGGASVNAALAANGGVASASSSYSSFYPASAVNNGDRAGLNNGFGGVWKDATVQSFPDWVQIDFSGAKTIDHVIVYSVQDNDSNPVDPSDTLTFTQRGITAFEVQSWNGAAWVSLGTVSGNNLVKRNVAFPATTTSRIRVLINAVSNGRYSLVAEIEAWTH